MGRNREAHDHLSVCFVWCFQSCSTLILHLKDPLWRSSIIWWSELVVYKQKKVNAACSILYSYFREGRKVGGNTILLPVGFVSHHVISPCVQYQELCKLKGNTLSHFMGDREVCFHHKTEKQQKSNKPKMSKVLYCDRDAASLIK